MRDSRSTWPEGSGKAIAGFYGRHSGPVGSVSHINLDAIGLDPDVRSKLEAEALKLGPEGSLDYALFIEDFVRLWTAGPLVQNEALAALIVADGKVFFRKEDGV